MNDDFEQDLRAALQRREPSADFAERVMARVPTVLTVPAARPRPIAFRTAWLGAIAAGVAALAFGLYEYREYQRGVEAKRQLMFALELTAQKLHVAQDKLKQRNQRP